VTGRLSISAQRCHVGAWSVHHWLRKGREENAEEPYRSFSIAVEKAQSEFLALAAKRLAQCAHGGILTIPKYDKENRLIRDADGQIVFEERYFPPNVNALAHILDRIDPLPNLEPAPDYSPEAQLSAADQIAQSAIRFDLFRDAVRMLSDLMGDRALAPPIETTATAVEAVLPDRRAPPCRSRTRSDRTPAYPSARGMSRRPKRTSGPHRASVGN
jgi:hypothetical protein